MYNTLPRAVAIKRPVTRPDRRAPLLLPQTGTFTLLTRGSFPRVCSPATARIFGITKVGIGGDPISPTGHN